MKKRNTGGFTLIELVIVIAVIAILAGISIPVYTAYIQKANEAADLQLLGAVNTAFAAACAERGDRPSAISKSASEIYLDSLGRVRVGNDDLGRAFMYYFGDNAESRFQRYTEIYYDADSGRFIAYDPVSGRFVGAESDEIAFSVLINDNDLTVRVKSKDLLALTQSAFGNSSIVTTKQLMANVQQVFDNSRIVAAATKNEEYNAFLAELANGDAAKIARLKGPDANLSNLMVFYAAQNSKDLDRATMIDNAMKLYTVYSDEGEDQLNNLSADELSSVAMLYGLATTYVYRTYDEPGKVNIRSIMTDESTRSGFLQYLRSDEGQADLNGYVSCMNILSENMKADSFNYEDYFYFAKEGYTATDIVSALSTILGQSAEA